MRNWLLISVAMLAAACYNPSYSFDPDAGRAFSCYASDTPACPSGLVCCIGQMCGDELLAAKPLERGWCVPPPSPADLSVSPISFWDFGTKTMYYGGAVMDPNLTGIDPATGKWRCHRDDLNPNPTDKEVIRAFEPNDLPVNAIGLTNPLPVDPPMMAGTAYEICPDQSAPDQPDVDAFKFKVMAPLKIIVELKYKVSFGDLDVAVFRDVIDAETQMHTYQRVGADITAAENACFEQTLQPGSYFAVVRGTTTPEKPGVYTMNNYTIRVFGVQTSGYSCIKRDM